MRARVIDEFRLLVEKGPDCARIPGRCRAPDIDLGQPRIFAQHFMRPGMERAVIVMRIVIAEACNLYKFVRVRG